jgi:hypothetical protein
MSIGTNENSLGAGRSAPWSVADVADRRRCVGHMLDGQAANGRSYLVHHAGIGPSAYAINVRKRGADSILAVFSAIRDGRNTSLIPRVRNNRQTGAIPFDAELAACLLQCR